MWGLAGAMIGDKIVQQKPTVAKGAGEGLRCQARSVGSAGASRSSKPEVEIPQVECKDPDMSAGIAMPEVSVGEFVYYMLRCCVWTLYDHTTGTEVPLEMLPDREDKYGVATWIQNEKGLNVVYPSTNKLKQMPGWYTTAGINGDNFQPKYAVKTTLKGKDLELAEKMKSKKPYYNYAVIPVTMYGEVLRDLGKVLDNNTRDTFFFNSNGDALKFFVGTTKDLLESKDWDYATSEFLGTISLKVKESKSATVGVDGNINVTTTLKQADHKGSSAGLTEYEPEVDRIPLLGSSVIIMPICLNKDVEKGTISLTQEDTCTVCGAFSAIKLTTGDQVFAPCGHTSLCSTCVSSWQKQDSSGNGTCPLCRAAWDAEIIAQDLANWEVQKRQKVDSPAELPADATAELPADATAELPADQEAYDPEKAKKRKRNFYQRQVNKQSTNMFVNGLAGWNILFEMRQHDGKDDDTGVEVFPVPGTRTENSLTYEADAGLLLKVFIENKSTDALQFRPVYRGADLTEEPENFVDLKFNEQYELPFPVQKDAGEAPDAWLLKDSEDKTVLTLIFTVKK